MSTFKTFFYQLLKHFLFNELIIYRLLTLIIIPHPAMSFMVMSSVGQILFGVMGYMSLWGLPINFTAYLCIVMSVGFAVDSSAHFCHSYMVAPIKNIPKKLSVKQERRARVMFALNAVGMPIMAGNISTIVALSPLSTAESEMMNMFWKCITLVMLFGSCFAVLYLPVVLSLIGPVNTEQNHKEEKNMKINKEDITID